MFRCSELWLLLVILPATGLFSAMVVGLQTGYIKCKKILLFHF
jgi:hypothetical protein